MKKEAVLFLFVMVLLASCEITVRESVHSDILSDTTVMSRLGCIDYDSVRFSDGSYVVMRMKNAPQNSLAVYTDNKGRVMATGAQASECGEQIVVYGYDGKGRLTHYLELHDGFPCDSGERKLMSVKDDYLAFRRFMDDIDFSRPDTSLYTQVDFVYKDGGYVGEVRKCCTDVRIIAPEGYKISVDVKQCVNFWDSDIRGGYYNLMADMVPLSPSMKDYAVRRWVNMEPSVEEHYRDGGLWKLVCYPNDQVSGIGKRTKTMVRNAGKTVYTLVDEADNSVEINVYENNRLCEQLKKNSYGTVLLRKVYTYLSDDKVNVTEERYNSKTHKPECTVKTTVKEHLPREEREMLNLYLPMWDNVYHAADM